MLIALLLAQAPPLACVAVDYRLPPPFGAWTKPVATLAPGRAVKLSTSAAANPPRPGRVATARFRVAEAGSYGVALDRKGWIDVYPATAAAPLISTAHGHGPNCSTIRKVVDFRLSPGAYRVELTGLDGTSAKLMLVKRR